MNERFDLFDELNSLSNTSHKIQEAMVGKIQIGDVFGRKVLKMIKDLNKDLDRAIEVMDEDPEFSQVGKTWNLKMREIQEISAILDDMIKTSSIKDKKIMKNNIISIILNTDPLRDDFNQCLFNQMPKIPKSLIATMDQASRECVKKHPDLHDHPFMCENVYWTPHQDRKSYTLHTHTISGVDYPSEADLKTTKSLKKKNLCIINTVDRSLTCYSGKNFKAKSQIEI